jgi:hypothetical protein
MVTQLQPFNPVTPSGLIDIDAFEAEIVRKLHDQILAGIVVHVDSPQIGGPEVSVRPQVNVAPADVTLDLNAICACLDRIEGVLNQIVGLLKATSTTTVVRDTDNLIKTTRTVRN